MHTFEDIDSISIVEVRRTIVYGANIQDAAGKVLFFLHMVNIPKQCSGISCPPQGFEIYVRDQVYFAFNKFESITKSRNKYIYCGQTFDGMPCMCQQQNSMMKLVSLYAFNATTEPILRMVWQECEPSTLSRVSPMRQSPRRMVPRGPGEPRADWLLCRAQGKPARGNGEEDICPSRVPGMDARNVAAGLIRPIRPSSAMVGSGACTHAMDFIEPLLDADMDQSQGPVDPKEEEKKRKEKRKGKRKRGRPRMGFWVQAVRALWIVSTRRRRPGRQATTARS